MTKIRDFTSNINIKQIQIYKMKSQLAPGMDSVRESMLQVETCLKTLQQAFVLRSKCCGYAVPGNAKIFYTDNKYGMQNLACHPCKFRLNKE